MESCLSEDGRTDPVACALAVEARVNYFLHDLNPRSRLGRSALWVA